jgi:2-dehydro-3-deoxyphosphooctonate aldolase (KDO 8-P synthase)
MEQGLAILETVQQKIGVPVLTDVHNVDEVGSVASVADVLQTPAFLCRQTELITAVAASGKPMNIKKGQFLAPWEMKNVVAKAIEAGAQDRVLVCERGASFGYNNLVSDMRAVVIMRDTGCPVVFDATHSLQLPGGHGASSGGQREFVPALARAAVAAGVSGLFMETHPDPDRARSDGPNQWPLAKMRELLETLIALDSTVKTRNAFELEAQSG